MNSEYNPLDPPQQPRIVVSFDETWDPVSGHLVFQSSMKHNTFVFLKL
jgi:hypothetical protein